MGNRVLVACEISGMVREAFRRRGFDAVSFDILPAEDDGPHIVADLAAQPSAWFAQFALMVAFPPCTHLAVSGARWFAEKRRDGRQQAAAEFFKYVAALPVPRIAIENPVGIMSREYRRPDQIIQPWMFGDEATKTTCLWLANLPPLIATRVVERGARHVTKSGRSLPNWYNLPPSPDRSRIRGRTFPGIAEAMGQQWGKVLASAAAAEG